MADENGKPPVRQGKNYTSADLGAWEGLPQYKEYHPGLEMEIPGRVFLKKLLGLTSSEISINYFPPGMAVPVYHHHAKNEEIYIFLRGKGQFEVDGDTFPVSEGSVVKVATPGVRTMKADADSDLYYIVIQAKEGGSVSDAFEDGIVDP